jgi:ribonuclease HI
MNFYSVYKGRVKGVFKSWKECEEQVKGYSGAIYKKFSSFDKALKFSENGKTILNKNTGLDSMQNSTIINPAHIYDIYTDGSLIRRDDNIFAGYGIYIPKLEFKHFEPLQGKKTNNRAELQAILYAINKFKDNKKAVLNIYTDSKYSILIFTSTGDKYKKNNYKDSSGEDVKNKDLVKKAVNIKNKYKINFIHVRAHTGLSDVHSMGNKMADELAVKGALNTKI